MEDSTRAAAPALDVRQAFETWREAQGWSFTDPRTAAAWLAWPAAFEQAWQAAFEAGRAAGIEEAAKVCEQAPYNSGIKLMCADRIRSLAPAVPASGV